MRPFKFQVMVLGTGSHAGKSLMATALCRLLSDKGLRVAPFKAQNMALNSGVTPQGHEIGRAQLLQAQAARCVASKDMNPVLLKPVKGRGSQVLVHGLPRGVLSTRQYFRFWPQAARAAKKSYLALAGDFDALVIEGAGSPAEVNLAHRDLANLETARFSKAPWILVTDIERGGAFASVLGTIQLVPAWMRPRLLGVVFNKFRGDASLLDPGLKWLWKKHGIRTLGVVPWLDDLDLDQEDSLGQPRASSAAKSRKLEVELLLLDSLSNFNEFSTLRRDPGVALSWRKPGSPRTGSPDLLIIPGSKHTLAALKALHASGESKTILDFARKGTWIMGICGGLQMLGNSISDAWGVDGSSGSRQKGLGLLPSDTWMVPAKITAQSRCQVRTAFGKFWLSGYEIHHGRTRLEPGAAESALKVKRHRPMLVRNSSGRVWGSYLHGLMDNAEFCGAFLARIAKARKKRYTASKAGQDGGQEKEIQRFASHVSAHLRLDLIPGYPR